MRSRGFRACPFLSPMLPDCSVICGVYIIPRVDSLLGSLGSTSILLLVNLDHIKISERSSVCSCVVTGWQNREDDEYVEERIRVHYSLV